MAESAQTEAADEEAGMRDGGMQKQERSSESQGPDAKCGLAAFLRRSDWPGVKALNGPCTSTAKTNCEMPIRGSRMQMTPDFEMLSREVERRKKPKFYSEKSTVQHAMAFLTKEPGVPPGIRGKAVREVQWQGQTFAGPLASVPLTTPHYGTGRITAFVAPPGPLDFSRCGICRDMTRMNLRAAVLDDARWGPSPLRRCQLQLCYMASRDHFIEIVLRCAQVAILNPSTHYQVFIPKLKGEASDNTREQHLEQVKKKEERSEAQFSPNTRALEVKGPDLVDLNFYDFPGVFITARRSEEIFLERVVQNLTREYISLPSAIILCAVPMNQDTENSLALKVIRGQHAQNRGLGVMTNWPLAGQPCPGLRHRPGSTN
ncbi:hypothetical protein CHGG_03583 [Chaetomium globosum CBS 148.51]|uniref:Dynamin N-terminal domain-containing protein n=1 Tax=Chaetomium globosum (strain ATCC 6205 / CBS 148.51 / DSM 1962 / NBRC 6347 / NRRL 1970) TaxID=306901 RepID=Q2H871_CHAGB|nr:uncharacterized protein CHGG_03583 [Chaetomium globosum CBS 148.51]EAQ91648.1 hypothetical protein CHGG_03583 [Chaetomium globosum CBS 148.51]